MRRVTGEERKAMQELCSVAHGRELEHELSELQECFASWRRGAVDAFTLSDEIHEFHEGTARRIREFYTGKDLSLIVASALARDILKESELPSKLREGLSTVAREIQEASSDAAEGGAGTRAPAKRRARRKADSSGKGQGSILQIKITLLRVEPPIWRRIGIPMAATFWDLHVAIQDAMGWTDSHLHSFEPAKRGRRGVRVGIPVEDFFGELDDVQPGWEVGLSEHLSRKGAKLIYEYDFGDSWQHLVEVEAVMPAKRQATYPLLLAGERRCPPEDCGGVFGYEQLLEAVRDPDHPEHDDLIEWLGGPFDPEEFDPTAVRFSDAGKRLRLLLSE